LYVIILPEKNDKELASLAQSARHSTVVYATPGSIPQHSFFRMYCTQGVLRTISSGGRSLLRPPERSRKTSATRWDRPEYPL